MNQPKVRVVLSQNQSDRLRFLQQHAHMPPLSGLVSHAVEEFLERAYNEHQLHDKWLRHNRPLEVVRD